LRDAADQKLKKLQDRLFLCRYAKRPEFSTRFTVYRMLFSFFSFQNERNLSGVRLMRRCSSL
jgi:hypothetical protein